MTGARIDFDAINAAALAAYPGLLLRWFPNGKIIGGELCVGDWSGNPGNSLKINIKSGVGKDWADDAKGVSDPVATYAKRFGVDMGEAARCIAARLGIGNDHGPAQHAQREHAKAAAAAVTTAPPRQHVPGEIDPERKAKVDKMLAGCSGIRGTPGETYFRNRGLRGAPGAKWRDMPRSPRCAGSVVTTATTDDGAVLAIQQTYVTTEGRKADVDVQKRTNKVADGWHSLAACRIPPAKSQAGGPIVAAEGFEDACTIRQCTGLECWPMYGIANIAHAPFPAGRPVIVARDNDAPGSDADKAVIRVMATLIERGYTVLCARPPQGFKDANAVLQDKGEDAVREMIDAAQPVADMRGAGGDDAPSEPTAGTPDPAPADGRGDEAWRHRLIWKDEPRQVLKPKSLENLSLMLAHHHEMAGVFGWSEFENRPIIARRPLWESGKGPWSVRQLQDRDIAEAVRWLEHRGLEPTPASVWGSIPSVAALVRRHPVREYLTGLRWDGRPRLDTWLTYYLGAPDTVYAREVGRKWLIAAAARVFNPGAKADSMLILEGAQGLKKSSACRTLANGWFTDELAEVGSKDSAMQIAGAWVVEISELDAMRRADVSKIKAWLSKTFDRYRPPYGRAVVDVPRQCVFVGTTNAFRYLADESGARRFWPVACTAIDLDALEYDRDQIWAEACAAFEAGERWWITDPAVLHAAAEEQDARYQSDAWESLIAAYLTGRTDVGAAEILSDALSLPKERWGRPEQTRIGQCMTRLGWIAGRSTRNGVRETRYRRSASDHLHLVEGA